MQNTLFNTTLALAGIVQAVSLVSELARTGKVNEAAYLASIESIFQLDPNDTASVYGGIEGVKLGLEKVIQLFSPKNKTKEYLMRYIISLLYLEKKITRSTHLTKQLTLKIQHTKKQVDYFHLTHPTVTASLADTYLVTISQFKFRIIVWGSQRSLSVVENMNKIRALLLAGIRSAVLWRQMGGSRWQLLFSRSKIKTMAEEMLAQIASSELKN